MPQLSNTWFSTAILFLLAGILLGMHMAATFDHAPASAHAHINLLGWVTMSLFGTYLALNPVKAAWSVARVQYYVYTVGVAVQTTSLYFLLSGYPQAEPALVVSSLLTFAGVAMFAFIIFRKAR